MQGSFKIRLLRSGWLGDEPQTDPMLGGALRVTINDVVVADDDEFGLERSALALLRTIDRDHDAMSDRRAFDVPGLGGEATYSGPTTRAGFPTLLVHDCGFPAVACSSFYVDWTIRHERDEVHITDVHRFDSLRPTELAFPAAACALPRAGYRAEIARFAEAVRDEYFAGADKIIGDPAERRLYDAFWAEYNSLLALHRA